MGRRTVLGFGAVEEERDVSGVTGVESVTLGNLVVEVGGMDSPMIEAEDSLDCTRCETDPVLTFS